MLTDKEIKTNAAMLKNMCLDHENLGNVICPLFLRHGVIAEMKKVGLLSTSCPFKKYRLCSVTTAKDWTSLIRLLARMEGKQ